LTSTNLNSQITLLQEPLPEDPPWWELFKVEKKEMYVVAKEVQALFSMPKVEYISVHRLLQSPRGSDIPRDNAAMVRHPGERVGVPPRHDGLIRDSFRMLTLELR
jgi:hypothetical protein